MKTKALAIMLCVSVLMSAAGCGGPDIVGNNFVMQAREDYEELDSAQIVMTNVDTGKVEQTFTFSYSKSGVLTYKDWKLVDGQESIEFNDGEVNVYYMDGKYYQYNKGEDKFERYTRKNKHKKTKDDMITYIPSAITDAKMQRKKDEEEIIHIYDVSEVNPTVPQGAQAMGFAVKFVFKKSGKLDYFTETTLYELDGKQQRITYKTEITQQNKVGEIANIMPVDSNG